MDTVERFVKAQEESYRQALDVKLKSSMTLFYLVDGNPTFKAVLDKIFGGQLDEVTADQLDKGETTDEAE